MGVAIVTFLQVLVLLQEDIDQKHSSAFFGQHTNDTKETLMIEQGKCVGNRCVASDKIPLSPTSGTPKKNIKNYSISLRVQIHRIRVCKSSGLDGPQRGADATDMVAVRVLGASGIETFLGRILSG